MFTLAPPVYHTRGLSRSALVANPGMRDSALSGNLAPFSLHVVVSFFGRVPGCELTLSECVLFAGEPLWHLGGIGGYRGSFGSLALGCLAAGAHAGGFSSATRAFSCARTSFLRAHYYLSLLAGLF